MRWLYVYREIRKKWAEEMVARDQSQGQRYFQHQINMDILRTVGDIVYAGLDPKDQKIAKEYG